MMPSDSEREPSRRAQHVEPVRTRTMAILGMALLITCLVLLVVGILPRLRANRALAAGAENAKNAVLSVYVVHPVPATKADLSLAGTTQAFQGATVYARTSGYVSHRYVDIGEKVEAGQLLAEIASPEIDQQLLQARAELRQSQKTLELQKASRDLAQVTRGRYAAADAEHAVAKEMVDQSASAVKTAEAQVAAAEANVESQSANAQRLQAMTAFERVIAPYDGTITKRNVDTGALITAGSPTSTTGDSVGGLFEVSQLDVLRVFVSVPQANAPSIREGMPATVTVLGRPDQPVTCAVTRTANALDPATRTLLVEIDIPNAAHELLPGMYVTVGFSVAPAAASWRLPATALVANEDGTRVVVIGSDNKLHFQRVVIGRDFGDAVEIQGGLRGDETIAKQPRISLEEGQVVKPMAAPGNASGGQDK